MPKHNSGRKERPDGAPKKKGREQRQQGKKEHTNKYAKFSRADSEHARMLAEQTAKLNTTKCRFCGRLFSEAEWYNHDC